MSTFGRSLIVVLAVALATPSVSWARTERTLGYTASTAFGTAVRFLRVNEGVAIIEKDADAGYILFDLVEGKRHFRGSVEVLPVVKDGKDGSSVRFVIQIADQPSYIEMAMMERLERKLRDELGAPISVAPPSRTPAPSKTP